MEVCFILFVSISNDHQIQTDIETMRGLSKRVRKKIYNDDYESKDVMDILEYIHYGDAGLTLLPLIQDNIYRNAMTIHKTLESTRKVIYCVMILKSV